MMDHPVTEQKSLRVETDGEVGLIALDNQPVNALGQAVRQGLLDAVAELNANDAVKVIAIYGEGKMLSGGADIREFGKTPQPPGLPDVLNGIEGSAKPVVAVIHGVAFGGGLELALSAHARVGLPGARVGLPEVTLGLLPGAGGTQRLPRLIPLDSAIEIITSGRHVPVAEAVELGLVDWLAEGTPREAAIKAARDVLSGALPTRRTGEISIKPDEAVLNAAREKLAKKRPALAAPLKCVDAIAASGLPIAEGLKAERRLFLELMDSPDRQGLIHAFQAERMVKHIPESAAQPRPVESAGVIGGGTMGVGIATALLQAGIPVTLIEMDPNHAKTAHERIVKNLDGGVKRGKMSAETRDQRVAMLTAETGLEHLSQVDVVIEAVFEDMKVKTGIFRDLDRICKPGAVLGTNTSYLDVNEIAAATSRPQDVIGLHFFSPAHIMRLLEVVVADKTAPDVVATAFAMAGKMKKVAVRSGVCDGFIGNRILAHYRMVADYMLLDGASFEQIDRALEDFGFAMGPFAVGDLAGLDIGWATRKRKAPTRPAEERYVRIADRICEQGWFGRKTGRGYYLYDDPKSRTPNPDAVAIVDAERAAEGISSRTFSDDEIVARYMTAMISEAARVVEEGIAHRPVDVDAVFLFGYGFPRHLGGPLNYADRIGAAALVERIEGYAKEDPHYWQVPKLLRELAQSGRSFADLNKE
ncbi:3-hydroxyacyl-CoA dehydrogenase NAD-binding domain-containing protein [Paracoccus sp. SCSIO 75233]|uniref:3-hydroxyacyl-CoA dehydrogenase NAD-binding domain-containing protein n=1 Tax=Paracoccus sp. SCSIO 75233 TaxID=3017782 RepID=UPI0022F06F48|nr:3-hydroxyacyl-CoA dehydrogenase NAD-binding domain-containing protein [Paracoccus sp. SCSIO 75233]WBU53611.1 3-hydroxyacyl-CoA dehydrogenase NAD-binding domain-containing protein [Paracoccus sp. SCSIO 75233]